MGRLDERALETLVAIGCEVCLKGRLRFSTYVDAQIPLIAGEPVGAFSWVYDGEKFIDGVFEVTCAECLRLIFSDPDCPRCHAPGMLAKALNTHNVWPVPHHCSACDGEEFRYTAMVPARVTYQGQRADKARTTTELHDLGFHAYRATCSECGEVLELIEACPLCNAPSPLRERP